MLPWIFNRNLTIFEAIEDTKERQFVCARSKRPHASASAGHVENFKTTISKNVISRRIYIYMYISPKKLTVSPPFFPSGYRESDASYLSSWKRCRNDVLFFNDDVPLSRSSPWFVSSSSSFFVSLSMRKKRSTW